MKARIFAACVLLNGLGIVASSVQPQSTWLPTAAAGTTAAVHFDAPLLAVGQDVTPAEFNAQNPLERLVAVRVAVSLLSDTRDENAIREVDYYLHAFENRGQIVDYAPKTTAVSDVVGSIRVSTESKSGSGVQWSASSNLDQVFSGGGSFSNNNSQSAQESFERLPSRDIVVTSGTIGRGSGVYFKLRQHSQIALEGEHHLMLVMQVPLHWRADYLRLVCRAYGGKGKQDALLANESLLLPIYADGDMVARNLAMHLSNAQRELVHTAETCRRAIEKRSLPTLAHELSLTDPEIPRNWLDAVIWSNSASPTAEFQRRLPSSVQDAVREYRAAQLAVIGWQGSRDLEIPAAAAQQVAITGDGTGSQSDRILTLKVALPTKSQESANSIETAESDEQPRL